MSTFPEVFDSSILASLKSCPQLFKKTYLDHWKPKALSVHLHAGKAFADGIEAARRAYYVEGLSAEDAEAIGLHTLITSYGTFECPADSAKSLERMCGALTFYFDNYPLNQDSPPIELPNGKKAIEFSFVHPLPIHHPETRNPILYCGRMDAILQYAGSAFITDEKTTTQLGPSWSRQWDLRSQFTGYAWGCREAGIEVAGAIVRGVSILKTKYETQQAITYRPAWQIERWLEQTVDLIRETIYRWQMGKWYYNLDHACADFGGCQFRLACVSEDETPWLESFFEKREWNPITREEKLL